jgi:chromosome segregation ATPase
MSKPSLRRQNTPQEQKQLETQIQKFRHQAETAQRVAAESQRLASTRSDELEAITERKLRECQIALTSQQQAADDRLEVIIGSTNAAQQQLDELKREQGKVESELRATQSTVDELLEHRGELEQEVHRLKTTQADVKSDITGLEAQKIALLSDISALNQQVAALQADIADSSGQLQVVRSAYNEEKVARTQLNERRRDEMALHERKALEKRQEYDQLDREMEAVRRDLAARAQAQDDRDRNLRIRELKVAQGEDKLQQNADLLNL